MDSRPKHYDGSVLPFETQETNSITKEPFTITDEMRKNIVGNPFTAE